MGNVISFLFGRPFSKEENKILTEIFEMCAAISMVSPIVGGGIAAIIGTNLVVALAAGFAAILVLGAILWALKWLFGELAGIGGGGGSGGSDIDDAVGGANPAVNPSADFKNAQAAWKAAQEITGSQNPNFRGVSRNIISSTQAIPYSPFTPEQLQKMSPAELVRAAAEKTKADKGIPAGQPLQVPKVQAPSLEVVQPQAVARAVKSGLSAGYVARANFGARLA